MTTLSSQDLSAIGSDQVSPSNAAVVAPVPMLPSEEQVDQLAPANPIVAPTNVAVEPVTEPEVEEEEEDEEEYVEDDLVDSYTATDARRYRHQLQAAEDRYSEATKENGQLEFLLRDF